MYKKRPIGVFDSGIGGLTVLKDLIDILPNEDFIYIADTAYCPYGTKSKTEITQRVEQIVDYLINMKVKAIIIACNTATANAKEIIEKANIPIIGVIDPTAKEAVYATKNGNIAVLATNLTIKLGIYQQLLSTENTRVYALGCSNFVPLAESNNRDSEETNKEIQETLFQFHDKNIDTVVYGCTHFGLLNESIKRSFPNAKIISCGVPTALLLKENMEKFKIVNDNCNKGKINICTTGNLKSFKGQISWFIYPYDTIKQVNI
ncbi:MAG: glutamate racemase [Bacilli bacterium]|nr:glutamate racemase [Bacilli bacterium]